jgi:hypothetical protein
MLRPGETIAGREGPEGSQEQFCRQSNHKKKDAAKERQQDNFAQGEAAGNGGSSEAQYQKDHQPPDGQRRILGPRQA